MAYDLPEGSNTQAPEALPTQLPQPTPHAEAPQGFALSPEMDRVLPRPPAGYEPSAMAPIRHDYEDSTLFKIGTTLQSFSKDAIPAQLKIKAAQAEADLAIDKRKLEWNNYYKSNEVARELSQQQNRDASATFLKLLPPMKAELYSMIGQPPEDTAKALAHMKLIANSLHPGGGDLVDYFHKNMSTVYAMDAIASHPDKKISGQVLPLINSMGYDNAVKSPQWATVANQVNTDWVSEAVRSFPPDLKAKIYGTDPKRMNEMEFRDALNTYGIMMGKRDVEVKSMVTHLSTVNGQRQLAGMNVDTDQAALAHQIKQKEMGLKEKLSDEDLSNTKAVLDFDKAHPGSLPAQFVSDARLNFGRHIGTVAKEASPGQFSENNPLSTYIMLASKQKYKDPDTLFAGVVPGSKDSADRLAILAEAHRLKAEANPMGQMQAQMAKPGDTSNYFVASDLRMGKLTPARGQVVEGDLRDSSKYIKVTPDQKKELRDIESTSGSADQIFDTAAKAYGKGGNAYLVAQAESTLQWDPSNPASQAAIVLAKKNYPDLAEYVSRREATLGKFARSVSGEVGVLTDQDVGRVRNLFPTAGDTPQIMKAKRKALSNLIALNRKFAHQVLAGDMTPGEVDVLKNSKEYRDASQGILGSVDPKATASQRLEEQTQEAGDKRNRGNSLLDSMKKGTP